MEGGEEGGGGGGGDGPNGRGRGGRKQGEKDMGREEHQSMQWCQVAVAHSPEWSCTGQQNSTSGPSLPTTPPRILVLIVVRYVLVLRSTFTLLGLLCFCVCLFPRFLIRGRIHHCHYDKYK